MVAFGVNRVRSHLFLGDPGPDSGQNSVSGPDRAHGGQKISTRIRTYVWAAIRHPAPMSFHVLAHVTASPSRCWPLALCTSNGVIAQCDRVHPQPAATAMMPVAARFHPRTTFVFRLIETKGVGSQYSKIVLASISPSAGDHPIRYWGRYRQGQRFSRLGGPRRRLPSNSG